MRTSKEHLRCDVGRKLPVSVVIPTLNASGGIGSSIAALADWVFEIVVVDGGSTDATVAHAERLGAKTITADKGRGGQLASGAAHTGGEWLLFLHADTNLQAECHTAVEAFIKVHENYRKAACFRFRMDDRSPQSKRLERMVAWRCRRFGLPYGDQGLLIRREFYEELGGFRPMPLMEDVDIVRRIGRRNIVVLAADAVTSAERYRRDGYWRRSARNLCLLFLFFLGVPPRWLVRAYV